MSITNQNRLFSILLALLATTGLLQGCVTTAKNQPNQSQETLPEAERMAIVEGSSGSPVPWATLLERARSADIIVLGEQHDDGAAHAFQAALVKSLAGPEVAVCMEMFERDEQPFLDAYLTDALSAAALVDITDSKDWGAPGQWNAFYQPIVDAAKTQGAPLVAANAPRRFVRLARFEGFEKLATYSDAYPGQFVVPGPIEQAAYAERFKETMRSHTPPPSAKKTSKKKPSGLAMPPMTEDMLDAMFRAQQVWDATMAGSVVRAYKTHGKAILIVGQFHTDQEGGLLLRMRTAAPDARILSLSLQKAASATLLEEDRDRADFVVYRPAD